MTPAQRAELVRLALRVPRPSARHCKPDPLGLEKLEAYVESYAERPRTGFDSGVPVIDTDNWYRDELTLRGRLKRWLGFAV